MTEPLVNAQVLEAFFQRLGRCFHDYEYYRPTADPEMFRRKFALLKEKLDAAGV